MRGDLIQEDNLYDLYVDEMFAYGMAFGVEKDTVLDAIHDVFLHILESKNNLKEQSNLKFYLFCCLKNRLFSMMRKEIEFESLDNIDVFDFSIKVSGLEIIEEEEERIALSNQIEQMLQELTSRQREVIYLRFMQELGYEEIAVILDITPKAARKLTYRAIEQIREQHKATEITILFFLLFLSVKI